MRLFRGVEEDAVGVDGKQASSREGRVWRSGSSHAWLLEAVTMNDRLLESFEQMWGSS